LSECSNGTLSELWEEHTAHEFSTRDTERTVGEDQLVDEIIFPFTHTQEMPWMLPGVAPTNMHVEAPLVVIVKFREGKLAHEHIYWDQASALKQIGLLTDPALPAGGAETASKVQDPRYVTGRAPT
jgi:carboxymethylenebutenolidase